MPRDEPPQWLRDFLERGDLDGYQRTVNSVIDAHRNAGIDYLDRTGEPVIVIDASRVERSPETRRALGSPDWVPITQTYGVRPSRGIPTHDHETDDGRAFLLEVPYPNISKGQTTKTETIGNINKKGRILFNRKKEGTG